MGFVENNENLAFCRIQKAIKGFLLRLGVGSCDSLKPADNNESIVQIIDEFQYLNSVIYRDKACTSQVKGWASGYMSTAEYKTAPLLVSGSWVGWLMNDLLALPGRFQVIFLENMPEEEIVEMAFKYSE